MKKILAVLFLFACCRPAIAQSTQSLKQNLTLLMPRTTDDDKPGTRGASVAWHPVQKKYYAAMAGNVEYPMAVYDATGKRLSNDDLNCNADVRGLWYNPKTKTIQGNAYDENGWFEVKTNAKGIPSETKTLMEGMNQPDAQSVGNYIPATNQVIFLNNGAVTFYNYADATSGNTLTIHWGLAKASKDEVIEEVTPEAYNKTVIYTGIKGAELGFLNTEKMQIELYNKTTGLMAKKLLLPEEAPVNAMFNFAYSNGLYWLFDIEQRKWFGYK